MAIDTSVRENGRAIPDAGDTQLRERMLELAEKVETSENNNEFLQEALAELELALEDTSWLRLSQSSDREFSIQGIRKIRRLARLSYLKNPLINHAVEVQAHYVWGQGVSITATSDAVDDVIQEFLDDPKNTKVFTGHVARLEKEKELQVHGSLFLPMFTDKRSGRVVIRSIFPDEIQDIITNPEDSTEAWYYKRVYASKEINFNSGEVDGAEKTVYYPDWRFTYNRDNSIEKPTQIANCPVMWDAPIYHVKVGGFGDMKWGIPEIYSALDWARAVKEDLENYATVKRALARFAWKQGVKGGKTGVAAAKKRAGSTLNTGGSGALESNPSPVTGSTFVSAEGWTMDPIKTAGAQPSPDEGHRMWLMVSSGVGLPETILTGNADVGNLATAKTLDRPTELKMRNRQTLWADVYEDILNYVIDQSVLAPQGALKGTSEVDMYSQELVVILDASENGDENENEDIADEDSRGIDVKFPSVLERDVFPLVQAIVWAATLNGQSTAGIFDDQTIAGLLMGALSVEDIDEKLAELFPDNEITYNAGNQPPPVITAPGMPGGPTDQNAPPALPSGPASADPTVTGQGSMPAGTGGSNTMDTGSPSLAIAAAARNFGPVFNKLCEALGLDPATISIAEPRGQYVHKKRGRKARVKKARHGRTPRAHHAPGSSQPTTPRGYTTQPGGPGPGRVGGTGLPIGAMPLIPR